MVILEIVSHVGFIDLNLVAEVTAGITHCAVERLPRRIWETLDESMRDALEYLSALGKREYNSMLSTYFIGSCPYVRSFAHWKLRKVSRFAESNETAVAAG